MLTSLYNTIFLQPQKKEIHILIRAAEFIHLSLAVEVQPCHIACDSSSNMGSVEVPTSQSNEEISTGQHLPSDISYSTRKNNALGISGLPSLAKGWHAHSTPVKVELEDFWGAPWTRCGTPCPKSWWPFAQLEVCAVTATSSVSRDHLLQSDVINGT